MMYHQNITPTYSQSNQQAFGHRGDQWLLITAMCLTLFGLVMVYSASWLIADKVGSDLSILMKQAKHLGLSLMALIAGMVIDIRRYYRWANIGIVAIMVVLLWQLIFGPVINNTHRWLILGPFSLQTSEVARCIIVLFLARNLTEFPEIIRKPDSKFAIVLLLIALPIGLTAFQPDLSSAAMMAIIAGLVLFLSGVGYRYLAGLITVSGGGMFLLIMVNPYQRQRLIEFVQMWLAGEKSYHLKQSLIGFGQGGIFGVGLGDGKQKMLFLPEPHTDFIFSIVGEEFGLWGVVLLLFGFLYLFYRAFKICRLQTDKFAFLLCSGLSSSIILYAIIHMCVTIGIVPLTGLPLPLISSGGTSLFVTMWSVGMIWNMSRQKTIDSLSSGDYWQQIDSSPAPKLAYLTK